MPLASSNPVSCPEKTSYWLGEANEMVTVNTMLIIVNSPGP
jgi:hypothetical protein